MKTHWKALRTMSWALALGVAVAGTSYGQTCAPCDMGVVPDVGEDMGQIAQDFGAASAPESPAPYMIGDFLNTGTEVGSFGDHITPFGVRSFKAGENNSAMPADRIFFNYSFFEDIGGATLLGRVTMGFEKLIGDGRTSVGAQLPTYFVDPIQINGVNTFGMSTTKNADIGDLVLQVKRVVSRSSQGDVLAVGAALQVPTGPATIADVDTGTTIQANHDGSLQPYIGKLYWLGGDVFLQYFFSLDVPFDSTDATMMFNDIQIGHYCSTCRRSGITALIPMFELHINTPLDDRQQFDNTGLPAFVYKDQVNALVGMGIEINRQALLNLALVMPLGSVHTHDYEFQAQLNLFNW